MLGICQVADYGSPARARGTRTKTTHHDVAKRDQRSGPLALHDKNMRLRGTLAAIGTGASLYALFMRM